MTSIAASKFPAAPVVVGEEKTPPALTRYVRIPLWSKSTPQWRQWTAVYIPSSVSSRSVSVDVILYLHGFRTAIPGSTKSIWGYLKHKCWPLREHLEMTGRQAVLIAPTLGPRGETQSLLNAGGLDSYLDQALASTASYWASGAAPRLRNLILAGHSAAGYPMRLLANSTNRYAALIREVWGFDCTYSAKENADAKGWSRWATRNPRSRLYIYYQPRTRTAGQAELLRGKLPNVTVEPTTAGRRDGIDPHFWVPIEHWRQRILACPFFS